MSARDVIADVAFEGKVLGHPIRFEMGRSKADAILSALEAAGFAVVPRRPTEEMELRGDEDRSSAAAVWFNMLSVAAKETP